MHKVKIKFSDLLLDAILLLFLMMTFAGFLANILVGSFSIYFPRDTITVIIAVVLMVLLHEITHIITLYLLNYRKIEIGAKVSKGVFCIYVKSPGEMPRSDFILVALSPLIFLTMILTAIIIITSNLLQKLFSLIFVLNIGGSAGGSYLSSNCIIKRK